MRLTCVIEKRKLLRTHGHRYIAGVSWRDMLRQLLAQRKRQKDIIAFGQHSSVYSRAKGRTGQLSEAIRDEGRGQDLEETAKEVRETKHRGSSACSVSGHGNFSPWTEKNV